jgi:hypothetical protein
MLDALRYTICSIQGINEEEDKWIGSIKAQWDYMNNGKNEWRTVIGVFGAVIDLDDDFGTFNPCAEIASKDDYFDNITRQLNNITKEEVDKVRAKFGKGFHLEKKCSHNMNKKWLLTSFYLKCDKCGYEEG